MKKILCIALTLLIGLQLSVAGAKKPFTDVPDNHWASDAINYFYDEEIINGISDETFSPDTYVTREQFAKLLAVTFNKTTDDNSETFSDVKSDRWSYPYIESVKEYLTGYYPEGRKPFFNPDGKATREDMAYALAKISGLKKKENSDVLAKYKDAGQISPALYGYIASAVEDGLIYGYDEYLRPHDFLTRAEAVTLLYRSIKKPVQMENEEKYNQNDIDIEKEITEKAPTVEKNEYSNNKDFSGYDYAVFTDDIESVGAYRDEKVSGSIEAKWSPSDKKAVFIAKAKCFGNGLESHFGKAENECIIKLEELSVCFRNKIQGIYSVTVNGALQDEKAGTVFFDKGGVYFRFDDEKVYFLCGEYKKFHISEEKAEDTSEDGTSVLLSVKSVSGIKAEGSASLDFDENKKSVNFCAKYTYEGKNYKITLVTHNICDEDIEGIFKIECDGKVIAENVKGKIDTSSLKVGEELEAEFEKEELEMIVTEISL